MASAELREELLCSICVCIFKDPVILRCGHNFCRLCIDRLLDTQDESGGYSCPECREKFQERPALMKNINLQNVAERFVSTQRDQQEIPGTCCTYCVDSPVAAVRSCLLCEASLCEKHLKVHSKSAEHVLCDPSASLEKRKCSVHKKLLEYYCTEDAVCICVSCSLAGEHRGHRVEMLDQAFKKKKENLRNVVQKLTREREKTEKRVQSLEERRKKAQEKAAGEAERVTAMCTDLRRRLDDLEKWALSKISRQEKEESLSMSYLIKKLEIKKDELSRKMRHIEELCNMTDPLSVLQEPDTGGLCDPEEEGGEEDTGGHDGGDEDTKGHEGGDEDTVGHEGGDEDTVGHEGGDEDTVGHEGGDEDTGGHEGGVEGTGGPDRSDQGTGGHDGDDDTGGHDGGDEDTKGHDVGDENTGGHDKSLHDVYDLNVAVMSNTLYTLFDKLADISSGIYGPAHLLLDVTTAAANLRISKNMKTATRRKENQNRPETAMRFQCNQVISRRKFSLGKHYWEVATSRLGNWRVGMCYPSMSRKGGQSYIGDNKQSWSLKRSNNQYAVVHDKKVTLLPDMISSDKFRICLDYGAGRLSFYELRDHIRHLHTFSATFTEPLHAAFCLFRVYNEERQVENWVRITS